MEEKGAIIIIIIIMKWYASTAIRTGKSDLLKS